MLLPISSNEVSATRVMSPTQAVHRHLEDASAIEQRRKQEEAWIEGTSTIERRRQQEEAWIEEETILTLLQNTLFL